MTFYLNTGVYVKNAALNLIIMTYLIIASFYVIIMIS